MLAMGLCLPVTLMGLLLLMARVERWLDSRLDTAITTVGQPTQTTALVLSTPQTTLGATQPLRQIPARAARESVSQ